jgi:hypothetical protein
VVRTGAARFASAVFAATLVASHAASFAHFLLVAHRVCPEHGELLHGGASTSHPGSRLRVSERRSSVLAGARAQAAFSHDREQCEASTIDRMRAIAAPTEALAGPSPFEIIAGSAAPAPPASEVALYRIAPKTSPPRPHA